MRAIFINAQEKTVEEFTFKSVSSLRELQERVGGSIEGVKNFMRSDGDAMDTLFVNEEGWLIGLKYGFQFSGVNYAGNGVFVGCSALGKTIGTTLSLEIVRYSVEFLTFVPKEKL